MWVSIDIVWLAVSCPTGMSDTDMSADIFTVSKVFQIRHFAFCLINIQFIICVEQSHSGTVITTIFKAFQSVNQNRICIFFAYVRYNSTHFFRILSSKNIFQHAKIIFSKIQL